MISALRDLAHAAAESGRLPELDRLVRDLLGPEAALAMQAAHTDDLLLWPASPDLPGPESPEPLPIDVLPPALRAHVASVAAATQTPTEMGVMLALAAVSAAVGGRADVRVDGRGWTEPVTVYAAVVMPPAARKSRVYAHLVDPLQDWERERVREAMPAYRRARDRLEIAERAHRETLAAASRGKAGPEEVEAARLALDAATADVPPLPRILASDASPEALVQVMDEHGGTIALLASEADPLGVADGRYSDTARVDELLRAWSGEPIRVDRIGRDPIHIPRATLTLGLCVQPAALEALRHGRVHRGRGLWGRVLWSVPPHGLGSRATGRAVPPLDEGAAHRYRSMLVRLLDAAHTTDISDVHTVTLDPDALEVLYAYEAELEAELADDGRLSGVRDWAGKAHGQAVRLAALLELAARAEDGRPMWADPIGAWAMDAAVELVRALTTHALHVLGEMDADREVVLLGRILDRARRLRPGVTLSDLHESLRQTRGLEAAADLHERVEELERRGCLRLVEQPREGPGRPPSPVVELHPALRPQPRKRIRFIRQTAASDGRRGIDRIFRTSIRHSDLPAGMPVLSHLADDPDGASVAVDADLDAALGGAA